MSIMRTYYTWQLAKSPDKSYKVALVGLWAEGELSIGIIIGCTPVMPRFFQNVGSKVSEALSLGPKPVNNLGYDARGRVRRLKTDAHTKIQNPFAKYKAGSNLFESSIDPYAQLHSNSYILNESESSPSQTETANTITQDLGMGAATRRDDLEYGR